MLKAIKACLLGAFVTSTIAAMAQQPGQPANGLVPLPSVSRWTDNQHFFLSSYDPSTHTSTNVQVDAKTGKETPYSGTDIYPIRGKILRTKNNDIYLLGGKHPEQLTNSPDQEEFNPEFSPDSSAIAFTRNHDLYVLDMKTRKETRLTFDGSKDILNGYASWVYMEEILGRATEYRAFWWNPDSKSIAFFRTDETNVPIFTITDAGADHGIVKTQRYPQPGDPNPEVKVGIVSVNGGQTTWADIDPKTDQYFGTPYWQPDGKALVVQWLNRKQQDYKIYNIDPLTGKKVQLYEEHQDTWINLDEEQRLTFLVNSNDFLLISDKSGYRQIYYYNALAKQIKPVTSGTFVVKSINYVDAKNKMVYFIANRENPYNDDLYKVNLNGKDFKRITLAHIITR